MASSGQVLGKPDDRGQMLFNLINGGHSISLIKPYFEQKVSVNYIDPASGDTALHVAARNNNKGVVELLLEHKADHAIKNKRDQTPIIAASEKDHYEVVTLIAHERKDQNNSAGYGAVLAKVVRQNNPKHIDLVETLLKQGAVTTICLDGKNTTPLHAAASVGNSAVVKLLLEYKANRDVRSSAFEGYTPIECASSNKQWPTVAEFAKYPSTLKDKARYGSALIDLVRWDGDIDLIKDFLKTGEYGSWRHGNNCLLHLSINRKDPALVALFLLHGACRDAKNDDGQVPAELAFAKYHGLQQQTKKTPREEAIFQQLERCVELFAFENSPKNHPKLWLEFWKNWLVGRIDSYLLMSWWDQHHTERAQSFKTAVLATKTFSKLQYLVEDQTYLAKGYSPPTRKQGSDEMILDHAPEEKKAEKHETVSNTHTLDAFTRSLDVFWEKIASENELSYTKKLRDEAKEQLTREEEMPALLPASIACPVQPPPATNPYLVYSTTSSVDPLSVSSISSSSASLSASSAGSLSTDSLSGSVDSLSALSNSSILPVSAFSTVSSSLAALSFSSSSALISSVLAAAPSSSSSSFSSLSASSGAYSKAHAISDSDSVEASADGCSADRDEQSAKSLIRAGQHTQPKQKRSQFRKHKKKEWRTVPLPS